MIEPERADYFLDITGLVCPLTFVRTKLLVERMAPGTLLDVRLNGGEALENVPRALAELGHQILALAPENPVEPSGVHQLRIRKSGAE